MAITNISKPSSSISNSTKVSHGETWATITTSWATETRTWASVSQLLSNIIKPAPLSKSFAVAPTTAARNDFTGSLGFDFSVTSNIYIYEIGRLYVAGNNQNHTINVWISTNTVTPIATATVLNSTVADAEGFKYAVLSSPVLLSTGNNYSIAFNETSGGDLWKDSWDSTGYINPLFATLFSSYSGSINTYPSNKAVPNFLYDTPSMKYSSMLGTGIITNIVKPT